MRVSPGRTGAQTARLESLTRPQSFGRSCHCFPRANPQSRQPSVGPVTEPLSCVDGVTRAEKHFTR
jgi:hypothetical protein